MVKTLMQMTEELPAIYVQTEDLHGGGEKIDR